VRIVGPRSFPLDTSTLVADPAQSGGISSAACQIQNSSDYQLNVNVGGNVASLQPFTAQTFPIYSSPIAVLPVGSTGSGPSNITLAFLLGTSPGVGVQVAADQGGGGIWVETPPQSDGPLTAQAILAAISGFLNVGPSFDPLASGTYTVSGGGPVYSDTISVPDLTKSYGAIVVYLGSSMTTPLWASAQVAGSLALWSGALEESSVDAVVGIIPFANDVGDTLDFTLFSLGPNGGTGSYEIFGLTTCPVGVRPDGRAQPFGQFMITTVSTATAPAAFFAAVPGMRILLLHINSLVQGPVSGTSISQVTGTKNAATVRLNTVGAGGGNFASLNADYTPGGFLLDENADLGLFVGGSGTPQNCITTAIFDLVAE
jgi:hypothetical protein